MTELNWADKINNIKQIAIDSQIAQLQAQIDEIKLQLEQVLPIDIPQE